MIVLDASVLIAHLDGTDAQHEAAVRMLLDSVDEGFSASVITLAEVYVAPARAGRLAEAQAAVSELGVTSVPLGDEAPARLAQLRATTKVRMPDCCVLLTAEDLGRALATLDVRQATAARALGLRVLTH